MISVCMATYNGEKYIKEQLDSILIQLGEHDEVVISDDNSTDNTRNIIEKFNDTRIKFHLNNFKKGVIGNFENALNHSIGDYIFLSDQDDIWHRDKVTLYLNCFKRNPKVNLVISDVEIINNEGEVQNKSFYAKRFNGNLVSNIIKNNFIGCSMAFSRGFMVNFLPFPDAIPMHDWWIGTNCNLFGEMFFIDKKLIYYRRHDNNFTKENGESFLIKLKWRFQLTKNLLFKYINIKFKTL